MRAGRRRAGAVANPARSASRGVGHRRVAARISSSSRRAPRRCAGVASRRAGYGTSACSFPRSAVGGRRLAGAVRGGERGAHRRSSGDRDERSEQSVLPEIERTPRRGRRLPPLQGPGLAQSRRSGLIRPAPRREGRTAEQSRRPAMPRRRNRPGGNRPSRTCARRRRPQRRGTPCGRPAPAHRRRARP